MTHPLLESVSPELDHYLKIYTLSTSQQGHAAAYLVEALSFKPEGR
jgi:hypothetical protein